MNINKVIIVGRLTKDPELKSLPAGTAVVNTSIATSRKYKDASGAAKEDTEFTNIVAFGKTAEIMNQYLKKGQIVGITGRLKTRSWDGEDGKKRYATEVIVEEMQMGPRAGVATTTATGETAKPDPEYPEEEINPDDIPF